MLKYILDQSHWNHRCYFPVARQAGALATFIRFGSIDNATGVPYEDYLLWDNVSDAEQYDFPYGAYWYMRPKFSGLLQANFYLDRLKRTKSKLPAWIDVEEPGDFRNIIQMAQAILNAGYKTGIYTRQTFWDYNIPADPFWPALPLWAARWMSIEMESPWADGRYQFRDWSDSAWKFWQTEGDGNGRAREFGFPGYPLGDNDVDLSSYNGSFEEFKTEYGLDIASEIVYVVNTQGLKIRLTPDATRTDNIVGYRNVGDVILPVDYGGKDFWVKDVKGWSAANYGGIQHMTKRIS